MGVPFNQLSPKLQAMIVAQGQKNAPIPEAARKAMENAAAGMGDAFKPKFGFIMDPAPAKKRLRQSTKPLLNKLEERFLAKLERDYVGQVILKQAVRLELARGQWYKPDFVIPKAGWRLVDDVCETYTIAYEVKGPKVFRGGFENLKTAARAHTWMRFYLVWEDDHEVSGWARQEVLA